MDEPKFDICADVAKVFEYSRINAEDFRGKTILVTGGTGFFGVWILCALTLLRKNLGGDLRILALSRAPGNFIKNYSELTFHSEIEYITGDIRSFKLNKDIQVTHLIHMATTSAKETFSGSDQLEKLEMLHEGTKRILCECGQSLEKVLFTSSGVAYGINNEKFITEDSFTAPDTMDIGSGLSLGKLVAEYIIAYYSSKFNYKYSVARCFAFTGPYLPLKLHYAFGNFIDNALNGESMNIRSDGKDYRSYLYIADAVAWLLRLLTEPKNEIFNVGSSSAITISELANKIAALNEPRLEVNIEGRYDFSGNFTRRSYVPCTRKILEAYPGLSEWTSIDESIKKMLLLGKKKI